MGSSTSRTAFVETVDHDAMGSSTSRTAFVETVDHDAGDMDMHEWRSAASALKLLGFNVLRFTSSEITTLAINVTTPVIGGRRSMRLALTQIQALQENQPLPERSDYPACLVSLLGRTITESTLGEALQALERGERMFIKPRGASNVKCCTGVVLQGERDAGAEMLVLNSLPPDTPMWRSQVLEGLVAEFRCYVLDGKVGAAVCYKGDETWSLDMQCVEAAAATLHASEEGSAAFALDMGVVAVAEGDECKSRTVLVEVNDGFALGLYPGCPPDLYARMMVARWDEICARGHELSSSNLRYRYVFAPEIDPRRRSTSSWVRVGPG